MTDPVKHLSTIVTATWKLVLMAFAIGMAWAQLSAQIHDNKLEADARFATMATDVHVLKVLACRQTPHDSVCF